MTYWAPSRAVTLREEGPNRRTNERVAAKSSIWYRTYKQRMRDGLEHCRWCSSKRRELTFGHILAHSRGGQYKFDNLTILCKPCNMRMGERTWSGLHSLHAEEAAAPPERRWAALAWEAARSSKNVNHRPMSPEREAMVPWVMAILIANGPDGEPLSLQDVRERLLLGEEDERTVLAALRASRRRGLADQVIQGEWTPGCTIGYVCTPGAQVPELLIERQGGPAPCPVEDPPAASTL